MKNEYIVFGKPCIGEEEIDEVVDSLKKGWIGTGEKVGQFERDFKKYKEIRSAVALHSCTAGLHLGLLALNLKPGDEVITASLTFCATVNAIIHSAATPVIVDVDPGTMNINVLEIEKKINSHTKAIVVVHFAGRPCEMNEIMHLAHKHGLKVIEDCAHAIETEYHGKKAGTIGDIGVFSFYATKNLSTGEGGMVISDNEEMMGKIKVLALHGMDKDAWKRFSDDGYKHYEVVQPGFKYNMMDIQAAMGIHQLRKIERFYEKRKKIWDLYQKEFSSLPIEMPLVIQSETKHALHLFTVLVNASRAGISRDQFIQKLHERGVGTGVHYRCIPRHPIYQKMYQWKTDDYPHADKIGESTVSLPLSPGLSENDVDRIISEVKNCFR